MLISSYVLITLGGTKVQLRESIKYVLINVISSFLFLVAVAYLYAITGTLNLAHLSLRIAEVGQDGLITTVAILFLIVFSLKAALFLFFWLPGSYSAPPTAVAAIFSALLTKVGIYAIFRMFTLVFYHEPQITHMLIGIMGALTMILGAIGAIAYWDVRKILAYNVIVSVGFIIAGLASFTYSGMLGSIYFITRGTFEAELFWLGAIGFITSLMVLYSVMKIFMNGFWGETNLSVEMEKGSTRGVIIPIVFLTMVTIGLGLGAEGIHAYVSIATEGLLNPSIYIEAVFGDKLIP
jgi:multicomponent Na+:H+ antiporter subunit D